MTLQIQVTNVQVLKQGQRNQTLFRFYQEQGRMGRARAHITNNVEKSFEGRR